MKSILCIALFASLLLACNKKDEEKYATVVKDCTGSYLRIDNKDFHICNYDKVASFTDGASVKVKYNRIDLCDRLSEEPVCEMMHDNEGWIEVTEVR